MIREPLQTVKSINITSASNGTSNFVVPVNDFDTIVFKLEASSLTGTSPTLDVYIQTTDDGGTTWYDVAHFTQLTATTTDPLFAVISLEGSSYADAVGDATISAGSVSGLPLLSKSVRVKYVYGGTVTASDFTITAMIPHQG